MRLLYRVDEYSTIFLGEGFFDRFYAFFDLENRQVGIAEQGRTHDPQNPDAGFFPCGFGSEGVGRSAFNPIFSIDSFSIMIVPSKLKTQSFPFSN